MSNLEKNAPLIDSGFLVVLSYEAQYRKYLNDRKDKTWETSYFLPHPSIQPEKMPIKYRGMDRESLDSYEKSDNPARLFLFELEDQNGSYSEIIKDLSNAEKVLSLTPDKADREIIWAKSMFSNSQPPSGYTSIGFEPVWFESGFSALCDCMHFMRWHGTDEEGMAFKKYINDMNPFGLFKTREKTIEFIDYYLSFDWSEHGEYDITEIFIRDAK